MKRCIFSGEKADSEEHVIPRWLQKRFNLDEEKVVIPNSSGLKYRYLKVPASKTHNSNFGRIEKNISEGKYDATEVYLWALKLHIGLISKSSNLPLNIQEPGSPLILDANRFKHQMRFFQSLYNLWAGTGNVDPLPIGSVYVVDSLTPDEFDLFHCFLTGTIGINVGDKLLLVFLWDQGQGLKSGIMKQWVSWHLPYTQTRIGQNDYKATCMMATHIWACESAYFLYRHNAYISIVDMDGKLALVPPLFPERTKPPNEQLYQYICESFGLKLEYFGGEINHKYSPSLRVYGS